MAKVELKQPIVQEISENIKDAQSVVVVDYRGLTVAEDTQLRKALREAGVTYKVYKNTLVSRAVEGTQFESLRDVLEGPNAFAISTEDATAPARVLAKFAKTAPALEIKAGVVEGTYYDEHEGCRSSTIKRRTSFQITWKLTVSDYQPCSRSQSDRRKRRCGRCSSRGCSGRRNSSCRRTSRDTGRVIYPAAG